VNGCPFGSFWASKMNVKKLKLRITLYIDLTLFITNLPEGHSWDSPAKLVV
jgi:hypothetical protein